MQSELVPRYFRRPQLGSLKLGSDAFATMLTFAQRSPEAKEAGGVLIGRHIIGTDDVVIDKVTPPSRGDRRTWASFHRARKYHQDVLDREWRESGGTRVYLGEWHTHPEPVPAPSTVDMTDWQRRLRKDIVEASFLFFLIVGQQEVRAWEGSRSSFGVVRLRARSEPEEGNRPNDRL